MLEQFVEEVATRPVPSPDLDLLAPSFVGRALNPSRNDRLIGPDPSTQAVSIKVVDNAVKARLYAPYVWREERCDDEDRLRTRWVWCLHSSDAEFLPKIRRLSCFMRILVIACRDYGLSRISSFERG